MSFEDLLKQFEEAKAELSRMQQEIEKKDGLLAEKEALIAKLQHILFGRKSEKSAPPPDPSSPQLDIFGVQAEATPEEIREETSEPKRERRPVPRRPIPADIPREVIRIDVAPEEKACPCCGGERHEIGVDATEKLAITQPRVYVVRYERPRYACPHCKDAVVQAPLPAMPLDRAAAHASLLAYIVISKYADHLPLCRMERIFGRIGIDLPRRKTCGWMMELANLCGPLVDLMARRVRERCCVINVDETPLRRLEPGSHKAKECRVWVYHGDERAPYTVYDFQETRGREGPIGMLDGYTGWIQSDDYGVYTSIQMRAGPDPGSPPAKWRHLLCWAHARRKFVEAKGSGDARAQEAIDIIGRLYGVERDAVSLTPEARLEMRQEKSLPILAELDAWMKGPLGVVPKSPLGKAIAYTQDNWAKLTVYTTDGRLPIDNNAVERAIRPIALGRKNWLFAGSERGGEAAATFFTLIESARRAGLNLWEYLTDLLERLPAHPVNRLEELLPDQWKPAAQG